MGLALALVNSPQLLFLDEPTTGLDPNARRAIWDVIRGFGEKGKTVILTTHYLDEAEHLSDRVAIMNHGEIVAIGTPNEIIEAHGSGERLEVCGDEQLASYVRANTNLDAEYRGKGLVSIKSSQKHDAVEALTAIERSGLEWSDLRTRVDSLDDVFVRLVRGTIDAQGEIRVETGENSVNRGRR
jgi:ABC-2 type transport system ATP-binding protein